jgi:hypothetical protein
MAWAQGIPDDAPFLRVAVPVSQDSALKLARFALGTVNGMLQPRRVQRDHIVVSTRYLRTLHSGAQTEVSLIVAIERKRKGPDTSGTMLELSAWAIDVQPDHGVLAMTGSGRGTRVSSAPMRQAVSSAQLQPYRLTRKDVADWRALEEVLYAILDHTAKK